MSTDVGTVRGRSLPAVGMMLIVTLSAACSSLTDSSQATATEARVVVSGTSDVPLQLVTSTRFTVTTGADDTQLIGLVVSDTTHVQPPIDRTVSLVGQDRFFVMVTNPSATTDATIEMRLYIDGREVLRQPAVLRDASIHFTWFLFAS